MQTDAITEKEVEYDCPRDIVEFGATKVTTTADRFSDQPRTSEHQRCRMQRKEIRTQSHNTASVATSEVNSDVMASTLESAASLVTSSATGNDSKCRKAAWYPFIAESGSIPVLRIVHSVNPHTKDFFQDVHRHG